MIHGIASFFRDNAAPVEVTIAGGVKNSIKILPLKRINFVAGSGLAVLFLVHAVAAATFYLVAAVFTGRDAFFASFRKYTCSIPCYLGVIPTGYIGALFPETVNRFLLSIPRQGLIVNEVPSLKS